MTEIDRRRAIRRAEAVQVCLVRDTPTELRGHTVDVSATGILVAVDGRIPVSVEIKGRRYQGEFVRAMPVAGEGTAYAIQLTEMLDPGGPVAA